MGNTIPTVKESQDRCASYEARRIKRWRNECQRDVRDMISGSSIDLFGDIQQECHCDFRLSATDIDSILAPYRAIGHKMNVSSSSLGWAITVTRP